MKQRKPIKRSTKPIKRSEIKRSTKPIRQVSERKGRQLAIEAKVKRAAMKRDGGCVAKLRVPEVQCSGPLDKHELVKRSAWPAGATVLTNVITICRVHHSWVDEFPAEAITRGLSKPSWAR